MLINIILYQTFRNQLKILAEKGQLQEEMLNHVSPLNWEHINFLGEYSFDTKHVPSLDSLRPLNLSLEE
jgi:hypothetical protein